MKEFKIYILFLWIVLVMYYFWLCILHEWYERIVWDPQEVEYVGLLKKFHPYFYGVDLGFENIVIVE